VPLGGVSKEKLVIQTGHCDDPNRVRVLDTVGLAGQPSANANKDEGMPQRIVVVSQNGERLNTLIDGLLAAGYLASGASTFADGKLLVQSESPDLVIADERLGPFNGLHLILMGRVQHPNMKAIVTSHAHDASLEKDARQLDVRCLVETTELSDWLSSIGTALERAPEAVH
jgi:DNA-binding NtrC family response regulator